MRGLVATVKNYDKIRADLNKSPEILEAERLERQAKELRKSAVNQTGLKILTLMAEILDEMENCENLSSYTNIGIARSRLVSSAWSIAEHFKINLDESDFKDVFVKY